MSSSPSSQMLDILDRRLIRETQEGLPIVERPYAEVAERLGIDQDEVISRLQRMLDRGVIRRIAVVPNHYVLGYRANAMTVWDVPDEEVDDLGGKVGALDFVSHCYRRPRHPPEWPYNLFAMVHGREREEADAYVERIAELLGQRCRAHAMLYSTRLLKKTGLRLSGEASEC